MSGAVTANAGRVLASIPSPTQSVWHLGPLPIRAYALCIVAGIIVAIWWSDQRWRARGGRPGAIGDVAGWAIVFGIIGGRLYHVITDAQLYFGEGRDPINVFKIYEGGLGIWGAIALGTLGAWIGCRRAKIRLADFADTVIPTIAVAQALGRLGNWFNNELYGRATGVPWKLEIHCIDPAVGEAQTCPNGSMVLGYFQPTFLYELLWCLGLAALLVWAERRWDLRNGQLFALYAMGYTAGRAWIEALRVDEAHHFLGLRLNDWTAIVVFLGGLFFFVRQGRTKGPATARSAGPDPADPAPSAGTGGDQPDQPDVAKRGADSV